MSYFTIFQSANDGELFGRISACCAQESDDSPTGVASALLWDVCSSSDIAAAYESAVIAGNPHPGADPAVITDQMILSAVQAHLPPVTP